MLRILLDNDISIPLYGKSVMFLSKSCYFYNDCDSADKRVNNSHLPDFYDVYSNGKVIDVIVIDSGIERLVNIHTMTPVIVIINGGIRNTIYLTASKEAHEQSQIVFIAGIDNVFSNLAGDDTVSKINKGRIISENGNDLDLSSISQFKEIIIK